MHRGVGSHPHKFDSIRANQNDREQINRMEKKPLDVFIFTLSCFNFHLNLLTWKEDMRRKLFPEGFAQTFLDGYSTNSPETVI